MPEFDTKNNKLVIKLVYYGPAMSGKTTNLMRLHDLLYPTRCGDLMSFETKGDRTLFFDFMPLLIKVADGLSIKIKLYTVPGQVAHDATRKAVLMRVDGVVFVADSQTDQAMNNFESFENLEKNIGRVGLDFNSLPLVIQFNKRDLNNIVPEASIRRRWGSTGLPLVFSSALNGSGVADTFANTLKGMYQHLCCYDRLHLGERITEKEFLSIVPVQTDEWSSDER
jgi:signal recognition particle receptor subunit beta